VSKHIEKYRPQINKFLASQLLNIGIIDIVEILFKKRIVEMKQ